MAWILCLIYIQRNKGPDREVKELTQVTKLILIEVELAFSGLTLQSVCFTIS